MTREGKEKPSCKRGNMLHQCASLLKTVVLFSHFKVSESKVHLQSELGVIITYLSATRMGILITESK